ncbi:hypothetical protein [Vibrio vulnificus]|uniref:hypothetical protein n=1 Tax=Vibrio vulnificus TaxID=672 RepID=UPI004059DE6A
MNCPNKTTNRRSVNWPVIKESVLSSDFQASEAKTKLTLGDESYSLHLNIKQDMHAMFWFVVNIGGTYHHVDIRKLPLSEEILITGGIRGLKNLRDQIACDFNEPCKFESEVLKISLSK